MTTVLDILACVRPALTLGAHSPTTAHRPYQLLTRQQSEKVHLSQRTGSGDLASAIGSTDAFAAKVSTPAAATPQAAFTPPPLPQTATPPAPAQTLAAAETTPIPAAPLTAIVSVPSPIAAPPAVAVTAPSLPVAVETRTESVKVDLPTPAANLADAPPIPAPSAAVTAQKIVVKKEKAAPAGSGARVRLPKVAAGTTTLESLGIGAARPPARPLSAGIVDEEEAGEGAIMTSPVADTAAAAVVTVVPPPSDAATALSPPPPADTKTPHPNTTSTTKAGGKGSKKTTAAPVLPLVPVPQAEVLTSVNDDVIIAAADDSPMAPAHSDAFSALMVAPQATTATSRTPTDAATGATSPTTSTAAGPGAAMLAAFCSPQMAAFQAGFKAVQKPTMRLVEATGEYLCDEITVYVEKSTGRELSGEEHRQLREDVLRSVAASASAESNAQCPPPSAADTAMPGTKRLAEQSSSAANSARREEGGPSAAKKSRTQKTVAAAPNQTILSMFGARK